MCAPREVPTGILIHRLHPPAPPPSFAGSPQLILLCSGLLELEHVPVSIQSSHASKTNHADDDSSEGEESLVACHITFYFEVLKVCPRDPGPSQRGTLQS